MATATLAGGFTYANVSIDSVFPPSGLTTGGENVTITGSGFNEYAIVYFGDQLLQDITVASSTEITGIAPPGTVGLVDVTVTQIDDSATLVDGYGYVQALAITQVLPNNGVVAGGEEIYIYGTGFDEFTTVTVGGESATGVTFIDSTSLSCTTPAGTEGFVDVVVTKGAEDSTLVDGFEYVLPLSISSVSPNADFDVGGKSVVITGYGFYPDATVTIGGVPLEDVVVADNTTLAGVVPSGVIGLQDVVVSKDGNDYTLTNGFTYVGSVQLNSITPSTGLSNNNTDVVLLGENFLDTAVVTIGGLSLINQTVVSSHTITGTVPPGATGAATVLLQQTSVAGLDQDSLIDGFTYMVDSIDDHSDDRIKDTFQDILYLNGGLESTLNGVNTQTGFATPLQMSEESVTITRPLTATIEFVRN